MKRKLTKAQRAKNAANTNKYKRARHAKGLCGTCGKPSERPGYICNSCRDKARDYMFKKYRLSHDIPLNWPKSRGRPRIVEVKA